MKRTAIIGLMVICSFVIGVVAGRARWRTSVPITEGVRALVIRYQARSIEPGSVMLMGDSLTERTQVVELCGRPAFNAGISGATASDLRAIMPRAIADAKPASVVIAVGTNDARSAISPNQFRADLRALAGLSHRTLAFVGIAEIPRYQARSQQFNAIVKDEARRAGVAFVSPLPARRGYFLADGIHHKPAGSIEWRRRLALVCQARGLATSAAISAL